MLMPVTISTSFCATATNGRPMEPAIPPRAIAARAAR